MKKKEKLFSTYDVVVVGVMAAVIFVATFFLKIPLPMPTGDPTMLKLANALCLLGGLLFGGLRGGLAAGIGSALFDLSNPVYARSAPFTLVFFFVMGLLCGCISHAGGKPSFWRDAVGAAVGAAAYSCLYITKSIVSLLLAGSVLPAAVAACVPKMVVSGTNAVFAVIVSVALAPVFRKALSRAGQGMRKAVSFCK